MARDAIARLDDVNKKSIKLERPTIIRFEANAGRSIDLEKLHATLKDTRLSGRTGSVVFYLEITVTGEVKPRGRDLVLMSGKERFVLAREEINPMVLPKPTPLPEPMKSLDDLRAALDRGEKVVSVAGRVEGWRGRFPEVLKEFPPGENPARPPPVLIVTDFKTAEK